MSLPQGWKSMQLGEIEAALPKEARKEFLKLVRAQISMADRVKKLKPFLRLHEEALQTINLVPDFAAYAISYALMARSK